MDILAPYEIVIRILLTLISIWTFVNFHSDNIALYFAFGFLWAAFIDVTLMLLQSICVHRVNAYKKKQKQSL